MALSSLAHAKAVIVKGIVPVKPEPDYLWTSLLPPHSCAVAIGKEKMENGCLVAIHFPINPLSMLN